MATLYVIGTPIGNLEDITLRALRILKEVDCILAEDTRTTSKLLKHHGISNRLVSFHSKSGEAKVEEILRLLQEGKNLALVSDAGTPAISDPGTELVARLRSLLPTNLSVIGVPGPSAMTTALSISGLPSSSFIFLGFIPHKKGRQTLFKEIAESEKTVVCYESPHRIEKTLESLKEVLAPNRPIAVCRELTKLFEESFIGSAEETLLYFKTHPEKIRGEFTLIIAPKNFTTPAKVVA